MASSGHRFVKFEKKNTKKIFQQQSAKTPFSTLNFLSWCVALERLHAFRGSSSGIHEISYIVCCPFVVQLLSHHMTQQNMNLATVHATPWTAALQASLSITISQSLLKLMSIESVMPSNHLILCHHPLLLPSIFPSIRVFSNELALSISWPKNWSFSFSFITSPSSEYLGLISFRIYWFDVTFC